MGLDIINQLNPKLFNFTVDTGFSNEFCETDHIGLIAQDIEEILPCCVHKISAYGYDDLRSLDITNITYVLINAVKELTTKLNDALERISVLENN